MKYGLLCLILFCLGAQAAVPSASLSASTKSGKPPLLVYFNAEKTTDSDLPNDRTLHELTFCYNADDGNTDIYSLSGHKTTNKAQFCGGPNWAYVFETAGTHTVTLTVIDETGNTDTTTVDIKINDWAANTSTACVSTSGVFTGCPPGARQIKDNSDDAFNSNAPRKGRRTLFRCNENFDTNGTTIIPGGAYLGAFDNLGIVTDRRCQFNVTSGYPDPLLSFTGDNSVVGHGNFIASGGKFMSIVSSPRSDSDHILVQGWNVSRTSSVIVTTYYTQAGTAPPSNLGFFENYFEDCGNVGDNGNCMYLHATNVAIVDTVLNDALDGGEHVVRFEHIDNAFIHNSFFGNTPKHLMTIRAADWNGGEWGINEDTEGIYVSDSHFEGNQVWPIQICTDNSGGTFEARCKNIIFERNYHTTRKNPENAPQTAYQIGGSVGAIMLDNLTVRGNLHDMTGQADDGNFMQAGISGFSRVDVFANSAYSPPSNRVFLKFVATNCKNNIFFDASGVSTMYHGGAPTPCSNSQINNWDADGGETGVNNLSVFPFIANPPANATDFQLTDIDTDGLESGGATIPYACDFGQTDLKVGSFFPIGAWRSGDTTDICRH